PGLESTTAHMRRHSRSGRCRGATLDDAVCLTAYSRGNRIDGNDGSIYSPQARTGKGVVISREEWHHLGHVLGTITTLVNSAPPATEVDALVDLESLQEFIEER